MRASFRSIKMRITILTVAFSLLVTVALVAVSLAQLQRIVRANLLQSIEFNLHLVAELISGDIQFLDRLWLSASIHPNTAHFLLDDYEDPRLIRALHTRLTEDATHNPVAYRYLQRLVVVDRDLTRRVQVGFFTDRIPLMPGNLYLLGDFSESAVPEWRAVKNDPFSIAGDEQVLYMISPVLQSGGEQVVGYIYMAVSANVMLRPLAGYRFLDQGSFYLQVGELNYQIVDGRLIETPPNMAYIQPSGDIPLNAATQISSFRTSSGERYLSVTSPVAQTGITLTQTFPVSLVLQETYFVVRLLLLICLGVFVLGALVALYLLRIINRPVRQIGRRVKAIAGGDFTTDPLIEWDDEFGEIGRGINALARDVEALMESRLESEKRKRDLEYKMLQNQINPHFLYNSLNSIKWMATIQNATGIAEITVSLSRLLKSVAKINQAVVPLSQEIALLEDYFVISRYRYGGAITSKIDVPEALLGCDIPIFTLQPIVENAIFHGIEVNGGIGTVTVSACIMDAETTEGRAQHKTQRKAFEIIVEDDGIGMDDSTIRKVFEADGPDNQGLFQKVGIYNVHTRIRYEFGNDYGIRIESRQGEFTRVIVRLPLRETSV